MQHLSDLTDSIKLTGIVPVLVTTQDIFLACKSMHYSVAFRHAFQSFCRLPFAHSAGSLLILLQAAFQSFCRLPVNLSTGCLLILL